MCGFVTQGGWELLKQQSNGRFSCLCLPAVKHFHLRTFWRRPGIPRLAPVCKCGPGRHRVDWSYLDASPAVTAEVSDNLRIHKDPWNSFLPGKQTPPRSGGLVGLMFLERYQAHSGSNSGSRSSSFSQPKKIKEPRQEKHPSGQSCLCLSLFILKRLILDPGA